MPLLWLNTNVSKSKITPEFIETCADTIAKILSKPRERVMVNIQPDQVMMYGGSDEPCGFCILKSIGQLTPEQNKSHAAILGEFFETRLGIRKNRLEIRFEDLDPNNIGRG